jgi:hypothetical protein
MSNDQEYSVPHPYSETLETLTPDGRRLFDELYYGILGRTVVSEPYNTFAFHSAQPQGWTHVAFREALAAVRKLGMVKPPEPKKAKVSALTKQQNIVQ